MISDLLLMLSWFFLFAGMIGLFRFKGVYSRILNSSKIDSVAIITLTVALMVRAGLSMMTLKLAVIMVFHLLTNPVSSQIIARSAKQNGIPHEGSGTG